MDEKLFGRWMGSRPAIGCSRSWTQPATTAGSRPASPTPRSSRATPAPRSCASRWRSRAAGQTVSVQVATADGTATAGSDYTPVTTTLTWGSADALPKYVDVGVSGDTAVVPREAF